MATSSREMPFLPRVIRLRDAGRYLGMDKNRFNEEVRPYVTEVRIGKQGVGFDRLDLDAWFDEYKALYGRPPAKSGRIAPQPRGRSRAFSGGTASASKKGSVRQEYEKALGLLTSGKRRST